MKNFDLNDIDIDTNGLKFTQSPLVNMMHEYEWLTDPRLARLLDLRTGNNWTKNFIKDLIWRAEHNYNVVFEIKGIRGSGKSYISRFMKSINDELRGVRGSINDIVFTRKEYIECYKSAKPGQTFIIDEDFGFQTQTGSVRIRETMQLAEQTFRIEEVSTLANSATPGTSHLHDFVLYAYDYNEELGINRAILFSTSQLMGMFPKPIAYILVPTKRFLNKAIEHEYQLKKKKFTTAVKQGVARTLQDDYDEYAEAMIKKFKWNEQKPTESVMRVYLRRTYPEMANTEISDIVETLKVRMYEIHGSSKKDRPWRG